MNFEFDEVILRQLFFLSSPPKHDLTYQPIFRFTDKNFKLKYLNFKGLITYYFKFPEPGPPIFEPTKREIELYLGIDEVLRMDIILFPDIELRFDSPPIVLKDLGIFYRIPIGQPFRTDNERYNPFCFRPFILTISGHYIPTKIMK